MDPLISIIIPVYNAQKFLQRMLESVCNQTYRNLEIIVVNDGSTDKSAEILEKYSEIDKRIKVYHTTNNGASAARNFGLEEAKGDYIGFVDADDWLELEMYEKLFHRMQTDASQLATCEMNRFFEATNSFRETSILDDAVYQDDGAVVEIMKSNSGPCNKLYTRRVIGDNRFCEELRRAEDAKFIYDVVKQNIKVSTVHEILYHYNYTVGSRSNREFNSATWDSFSVVEYIYDDIKRRSEKNGGEMLAVGSGRLVGGAYRVFKDIAQSDAKLQDTDRKKLKKIRQKLGKELPVLLKNLQVPFIEKIGVIIMALSPDIYIRRLKAKKNR